MKKNGIELIGNTPVVKLNNIVTENMADIYIKLEGYNLSGSVKARAALNMIEEAEERGDLKKGYTIIEPTSGNTGIAIALIGALKGYKVKIVMPDSMSLERREIIKAYGAELVLTDGSKGMAGSIEKAEELVSAGNAYSPEQFSNADNWKAHYKTTAVEILRDIPEIDAFVVSIGTGGTVTGVGKRFEEEKRAIQIIGIEPEESAVINGKGPSKHKIQGIGAGFIPKTLDVNILDETLLVHSDAALEMTKRLVVEEGLMLGISSGANVVGAIEIAKRLGKGKTVVTISPDNGDKYISTGVFK